MNNKGFSMVEILAVVAILAILMGVAISAATRYQDKSRKQAYETLVASSKEAAESYAMDYPSASEVDIATLVEDGYLESSIDPADKVSNCTGKVVIENANKGKASKLQNNKYTVHICCKLYKYVVSSDNTKTVNNDC